MTPAGETHYIHDLDGRPIAEATDTGTMLREYVWVDDMPVAVFAGLDTASPQLYYVHPDHLNRPLRMTDGGKTVVWDAVYRPFGEAHAISGSASLNLRFPGQYYLLEHGLAYNWHRYYDPTIGRYTRPDPIADNRLTATKYDVAYAISESAMPFPFQDGPSVYAYALSSPLYYIDPSGLAPNDKWYGYNNRDFQAWCHRQQKRPGDPDFTKQELDRLWKQWNDEGRPGPDSRGRYSRRGGGSRGGGGLGPGPGFGGGPWKGGTGWNRLPPWQ
jgi:RHS repeat-associated protein